MSDLVTRLNACVPEVARGEANIMKARLLQDAATELARLTAEVARLRSLLRRYRIETPLGHQPHRIAAEVDAALEATDDQG